MLQFAHDLDLAEHVFFFAFDFFAVDCFCGEDLARGFGGGEVDGCCDREKALVSEAEQRDESKHLKVTSEPEQPIKPDKHD